MVKPKTASAKSKRMSRFALAFGGLFALIGLICLTVAWLPVWNDYRHGKQFAANGAVALGMVLTKTRSSAGSVVVLGVTKEIFDYSVRYRFATSTGRKMEAEAKVTPEQWGLLEERGPIKVRYLADYPETTHVSGQQSSRSWMERLILSLVGGGFIAVGGLMLFLILKNGKQGR
ncbi:MAG: hypothetical protein V7640_3753 [Betaproteobacteria bacterium]|jgi:hypothetical protein